jgi:hypothetical protein
VYEDIFDSGIDFLTVLRIESIPPDHGIHDRLPVFYCR